MCVCVICVCVCSDLFHPPSVNVNTDSLYRPADCSFSQSSSAGSAQLLRSLPEGGRGEEGEGGGSPPDAVL